MMQKHPSGRSVSLLQNLLLRSKPAASFPMHPVVRQPRWFHQLSSWQALELAPGDVPVLFRLACLLTNELERHEEVHVNQTCVTGVQMMDNATST